MKIFNNSNLQGLLNRFATALFFFVTAKSGWLFKFLKFLVKIPNIDNGLAMYKFEEIIKNYVKVRTQEYYKWKDYQYSIQYAGELLFIRFEYFFLLQIKN